MELLLALAAIVIGLELARRRFLHPGDYLVAASLAVMLAVFVLPAIPTSMQGHVLAPLGAPRTAVVRSDFLAGHGVRIVVAALLAAVGYGVAALVRRRQTPEWYA